MNPLQITPQNLGKESNCFEINLCHEPSILVLALLIDPPFPSQLLALLHKQKSFGLFEKEQSKSGTQTFRFLYH